MFIHDVVTVWTTLPIYAKPTITDYNNVYCGCIGFYCTSFVYTWDESAHVCCHSQWIFDTFVAKAKSLHSYYKIFEFSLEKELFPQLSYPRILATLHRNQYFTFQLELEWQYNVMNQHTVPYVHCVSHIRRRCHQTQQYGEPIIREHVSPVQGSTKPFWKPASSFFPI